MDRRTLGSWLNGPRATLEAEGVQLPPRGKRLGRPADGSGSVASFGRRLVALFVDWALALGLTRLATIGADVDGQAWDLLVLAVFAAMTWGTLAATGRTPGYQLLGLRLEMARPTEPRTVWGLRTAIRSLLLVLVVPAAVWDADGRGLHDKAAGTAVVRA
ncbi:RDD family protein [Motilibacter sp. K478]|nr:RDD family protein [Motilibacter aurantiacus]